MRFSTLIFALLTLCLLAVGCTHAPASASRKALSPKAQFENELAPYLAALRGPVSRALAGQRGTGGVLVYLPSRSPFEMPAATAPSFAAGRDLDPAEIESLRAYIGELRESLGARGEIAFFLQLVNQWRVGTKSYVRFEQLVRRQVNGNAYAIPIEGATIVAQITGGKLVSLNSRLATPASLGPSLKNPGFGLALTDNELATLMTHVKLDPESGDRLRRYFAGIAQRAGRTFDFDAFLNRELAEQRTMLGGFLQSLGRISTARLLIDLARHRQLSLVQYGEMWMFQVSDFFGLPIEFDIVIPTNDSERLVIKNLRETRQKVSVQGFFSPHFPGGKKEPGGDMANRAAERMQGVVGYFSDRFGWMSYAGKTVDTNVEVHVGLKSLDFKENASWIGSMKKFIVGEGGPSVTDLVSSTSVLGHEYTHAIVQFSSALPYKAEAGALNEHIADVEGASAQAVLNNGGRFLYTVGEDVLTPAVQKEKAALLDTIIAKYGYTDDLINTFDLRRPSLRHLYSPALSFATQLDHMDDYRKAFPEDCQPSVDNDNCGVHSGSGVVNKAAALIIGTLGLEATRDLFFNTVIYRLSQKANFVDYLIQLYDECQEEAALAPRCDVILASFARVGIIHPEHALNGAAVTKVPPSETTPSSKPAPTSPLSAEPLSAPAPTAQSAYLLPFAQSSTPPVKICGSVDRRDPFATRLVDGKTNPLIVRKNRELMTSGNLKPIDSLDCACATGSLTHLANENGKIETVFLNVSGIEPIARGNRECLPLPIAKVVVLPQKEAQYCGWISASTATQKISVVTNRRKLLLPPELKIESAAQCACVTGVISTGSDGADTVTARLFSLQPPIECAGVRWK